LLLGKVQKVRKRIKISNRSNFIDILSLSLENKCVLNLQFVNVSTIDEYHLKSIIQWLRSWTSE
jgi:hypothetical protein